MSESERETGDLIKERRDKLFNYLKKGQKWVLILLIVALILGVYIRSMPMQDHNGRPGLWDVAKDDWTLGPDLDPWLFLRNAKTIVEEGGLPAVDTLRYVPLGFDNTVETQLLPYMIAYTHKAANLFGDYPIEFAGSIFPVIMFFFTIISFFLFVREIFLRKGEEGILRANIISIIATFFMIVIPVFVTRTIAGIPEKESAAFFFMFLAFYLFLKAWKSKKVINATILGAVAGISTGIMGLIWGGYLFIFIPIALASLVSFVLNKFKKVNFFVYISWFILSVFTMVSFSNRYPLMELIQSLSVAPAVIVLFILLVHLTIFNTGLKNINLISRSKLPKPILSFIIGVVILFLIAIIFFGPSFILDKAKAVHQAIFKPTIGRWNITVAENRQPSFKEWSWNFGPSVNNIPIIFWLFFIGSIVMFKKMLRGLRNKDQWTLTAAYVFLLCGMIFSRYSGDSIFNGDNFISKAFYYIAVFVFLFVFVRKYLEYEKRGEHNFRKIRFDYILLFALFLFTIFSVRGAVRLIMMLGPVAPIFVGFLIVELIDGFKGTKDLNRLIMAIAIILVLVGGAYSFFTYYNVVKGQAYGFIPSAYNMQWQHSMNWVRENTPTDAVFGHWWDYGYWVQSIGERATVLDGGNKYNFWNYRMGRHVLTGDNQDEALEFLYNHNTTHFLIDSTDIGKYTAFSSIGSDENYDRYSYISPFLLDESQTQETNNQTIYAFVGGISLDEDLVVDQNGREVLLPRESAGVVGILVPSSSGLGAEIYGQPRAVINYQGQRYDINMRYLHYRGQIIDFGTGIESVAYIFPRINVINGGQVQINERGAMLFLSPRLTRGMLTQVYILDDAFGNFPNFKLAHSQSSLIVEEIRKQGQNLPEFVYYNGIQGPIKIWELEYTGKEKLREDYIDTDATKYISWKL